MNTHPATALQKRWTASELMKLPRDKRDAILEQAAARAEADHHADSELTDFEAFGAKDLYGGSAGAQTRSNLADRFRSRGRSGGEMDEIALAIALCIGLP